MSFRQSSFKLACFRPRKDFNATKEVKRLSQFIREEKPYFESNIDPRDLRRALVVKPKFNSQRITVQAGAFLIFGLRGSLEDEPDPGVKVERITIGQPEKRKMLADLAILGFSDGTLFPEIESAARHIRERV